MTVIRDAVVRLRLEQQKARVEVPDTGPAVRAHEAEKKAVEETTKAKMESAAATKELAHSTIVSTQQMLVNFREGGEGILRFGRGLAFLSANGSEDLKKLVQQVALAQGAFDVFAGGFKVFRNLGTPLGITVTAFGAGVMAINRYTSALERAAEQERKTADEMRMAAQERNRIAEETADVAARGRTQLTDVAIKPGERLQRLGIELAEINQRTRNTEGELRNISNATRYERADREEARAKAEQFPSNRIEAFRQYGAPGAAGEALGQRQTFEQAAADARQRELDLLTREAGLREQTARDHERRLQIERERFETERDRLTSSAAIQSAAFLTAGTIAGGGAGAVGLATPAGAFNNQTAQQIEVLTRETQQAFDKLIGVVTSNNQRLVELRRELDQGNSQ